MKRGLVMEGGGMRGLFTAGVTDVFLENKIVFEGAIGTSAGAVFGCNYKSNQPGRVLRYNLKYGADPRYGSLRSLLLTGDFYNKDFAYREVPFEKFPFDTETFQKNPMEFYVVCTDVETGRPFYYRCEKGDAHDVEYMRASASMPLVARIVEVDGHKLLDGGITDSIPLKKMLSLGYEKNVVILKRPKGYRNERGDSGTIVGAALRGYPRASLAMKMRHLTYNQNIRFVEEEAERGRALLIYPRVELGISRIASDPGELMRVYELGRGAGLRALERVRAYLGE